MATEPEYWLRGPVPDLPALLQPIAHAFLQARHEITIALVNFPDQHLWTQPAGQASVGFHLQHLRGVMDRLFTYAQGHGLSATQLESLAAEGKPYTGNNTVAELLAALHQQVDACLEILRHTDPNTLTEVRGVGRAKIPSTVAGLLFHAAEHTMRHTGQLLVTAKWVLQEM